MCMLARAYTLTLLYLDMQTYAITKGHTDKAAPFLSRIWDSSLCIYIITSNRWGSIQGAPSLTCGRDCGDQVDGYAQHVNVK